MLESNVAGSDDRMLLLGLYDSMLLFTLILSFCFLLVVPSNIFLPPRWQQLDQ